MTSTALFQDEHLQAENLADWRRENSHINCARCGGLMVTEQHVDLPAQRCVQCGEFIDPVILQNRQRHLPVGGRARRSLPGVAMRSMMLVLFLAGISTLAIAAGQDLRTEVERSGAAARVQSKTPSLSGNDWKVITVELKPGAVESWQSRSEGELLYVLEGSGRLEMGGKPPVTLNPGTVARLEARPSLVVKNTSGGRTLKVLVVFLEKGEQHPLLADRRVQGQRESKESILNGAGRQLESRDQESTAGLVF